MTTTTGGFTIVDFTVPSRDSPVIHPCASAPICDDCRSQDLCFFDPTCSGCQEILSNPKTTISELFAIIRQWIPQTQKYLSLLMREVLRRGAHVDDKDSLTDLSLLHYACKAGALVNNGSSSSLVSSLITKGADTNAKCHWTDMNALHYAVYFDCDDVVEQLCEHNPALVPTVCNHFDRGNSLHIAAANLSLKSARVLIKYNADGGWKDEKSRLPHECIPVEDVADENEPIATELRDILKVAAVNRPQLRPVPAMSETSSMSSRSTGRSSMKQTKSRQPLTNGVTKPDVVITTMNGDSHSSKTVINGHKEVQAKIPPIKLKGSTGANSHISTTPPSPLSSIQSPSQTTGGGSTPGVSTPGVGTPAALGISPDEPTLDTLGIKIGDKVTIDSGTPKSKVGTLRFYGKTEFAPGHWAGIELGEDVGRNDGSHSGIRYFSCKPKRGLFVPLKRITKCQGKSSSSYKDGSTVTLKDKGKKPPSRNRDKMMTHSLSTEYQVGERVVVKDNMGPGVVRFVGPVKFGPGVWLGVELDRPKGICDGSQADVRYFKCRHNYGIFVYPSKVSKISDKESTDRPSSSSSGASPTTRHKTPPISRKKHAASPIIKSTGSASITTGRSKARPYTSPVPTSISLANSPLPTLEKGMSVFTNKEKGILQYIGHTEFAPGLWLGIELKKPSGKNDGSVNGKRYFSCRPNYGIFVKPEKVTHRGINCSKLIKPSEH